MRKTALRAVLSASLVAFIASFANAGSATSDADLYVSDPGSGEIFEFTPDGKQTSLTTFFNRNGLRPFGVAIDSAGSLFVSSERPPPRGFGVIHKFTLGRMLTKFATGLNSPVALAFDSGGHLFESDLGSGRIFKFTPDGTRTTFSSSFLDHPYGLAFDSAGNLFEADDGSGRIFKFTPDGMQTTFASGLKNPLFLAFGPASAPVPDSGATVVLLGISALGLLWVHRL